MPLQKVPEGVDSLRDFVVQRLGRPADASTRSDYDLNPDMRAEAPENLIPAAVLVPLIMHEAGASILLTKRTDHLKDHAGQVSFPGGRVEEGDESATATALRETKEEVGIDASYIEIVGKLDIYETRTGFRITPVVGLVEPRFSLTLEEFEVAEAFEVPLSHVLDPVNHERSTLVWRGAERHFYAVRYGERYIWGATAGMIVNLYARLME